MTGIASNDNRPLKLLWIGAFEEDFRIHIALRTIIALNRRDLELHICGDGTEEAKRDLQDMVEAGGIATLVYWHGNLSYIEEKKMMKQCDLLFHTSIAPSSSSTIRTAISIGFPVLCYNFGSVASLVKASAGYMVELTDQNQSVLDFAAVIRSIVTAANPTTFVS